MLELLLSGDTLPDILQIPLVGDSLVVPTIVDERNAALPRIGETVVHRQTGTEVVREIQLAATVPDDGTVHQQVVGVAIEQFDVSEIARRLIFRNKWDFVASVELVSDIQRVKSLITEGQIVNFGNQDMFLKVRLLQVALREIVGGLPGKVVDDLHVNAVKIGHQHQAVSVSIEVVPIEVGG